jgi:DNA-binding LacI/PurR family transcriptional regulator
MAAEPTLHDVANRAGVSIKTVSNVLRGVSAKASETVVARVHEAIDELNYRPNLAARRLRTGHSDMIALAVPDLRNPYFAELSAAMITAARAAGLTLLVEVTGGTADQELGAAEGLYDPMIEGVILSPLGLDANRLASRSRRLPLVLLGEREYDGPDDHVRFDNIEASYRVTEHLVQQGYSRIAVIGRQEDPPHATAVKRLMGYKNALHDAGLSYQSRYAPILSGAPYGKAMGATAAHSLFTLDERPDAIYCFADVLAFGALRAAHECGLRAPHDFGLAGFDGVDDARFSIPTLTTVAVNFADLANLAVNALVERIGSKTSMPGRELHCRYDLIIGESSRPHSC